MSLVSAIATYTAVKFVRRKMDHSLSKDETTGIHPSLSKTRAPRCPRSFQSKTLIPAPKVLFLLTLRVE